MNLVSRFSTTNFSSDFYKNIEDIIEELSVTGETLDITDAKLVPSLAKMIMDSIMTKNLNVVDTKDPIRQERIRLTEEARQHLNLDYTPLPELVDIKDLESYLRALDKNTVYRLSDSSDRGYNLSLVILIMIIRPAIKFDATADIYYLGLKLNEGFKGPIIQDLIKSTDTFLFVKSTEFFQATIKEKDLSTLFEFNGEYTTWDRLLGQYKIIPDYFGNEPILKNPERAHLFRRVIAQAKEDLVNKQINREKSSKRLVDYLKG